MTKGSSNKVVKALTTLAKISPLSINDLRLILALERVVARLEMHEMLKNKLVFKGGFVLLKTLGSQRFTRDIDASAQNISKGTMLSYIIEALRINLNDELYFYNPNIEEMMEDKQYGGYRVNIPFQIGYNVTDEHKIKKLPRVHLDISFDDAVKPTELKSLLYSIIDEFPPVSWSIYPIERIISEKLETLVSRGSGNSRSKDLYDIVTVFKNIDNFPALKATMEKTFRERGTVLPNSFSSFFDSLDLLILRNSWKAITFQENELSFDECINDLKIILRKIDDIFT